MGWIPSVDNFCNIEYEEQIRNPVKEKAQGFSKFCIRLAITSFL